MSGLLALVSVALLCSLGHVVPDVQRLQPEVSPSFSVRDVARGSVGDPKVLRYVGEVLPSRDPFVDSPNQGLVESPTFSARPVCVGFDVDVWEAKVRPSLPVDGVFQRSGADAKFFRDVADKVAVGYPGMRVSNGFIGELRVLVVGAPGESPLDSPRKVLPRTPRDRWVDTAPGAPDFGGKRVYPLPVSVSAAKRYDLGVCQKGERVVGASDAVASALSRFIDSVVLGGAEKQVGWVDAWRVVTFVANMAPQWDGAVGKLKRHSMRWHQFGPTPESAISCGHLRCKPGPAFVGGPDMNLGPESLFHALFCHGTIHSTKRKV